MAPPKQYSYWLFNKPYGVLCQFSSPDNRPTLKNYIPIPGIYPVGRLDYDSEGLLLLTDDGSLNQRLANPRYKQPKRYLAQVEGIPTSAQLQQLAAGIKLPDGWTAPAKVKLLTEPPKLWPRSTPIRFRKNVPTAWLELTITEGRNRQVRRMTAAVGLPCLRLIRLSIGPLGLKTLLPGEYAMIKKPNL